MIGIAARADSLTMPVVSNDKTSEARPVDGSAPDNMIEPLIEVQRALNNDYGSPDDGAIVQWCQVALEDTNSIDAGVTIRLVEANEIRVTNQQWRGKDKSTNVLSFPADFPAETGVKYLGDIMICPQVLETESLEQGKALADHWAHIVVHGVLHLLGYDHEQDSDAQSMEQREREILASLNIADPYSTNPDLSGADSMHK